MLAVPKANSALGHDRSFAAPLVVVAFLLFNRPWARKLTTTIARHKLSYGPYWYGKWSLGDNLELHDIDRMELDVRTIEAFDVTPEQRAADNNKKNRERGDKNRSAAGVQTRDQYLAKCKSHTKPWLAAGFKCRRTWERHQKKGPGGGVSQLKYARELRHGQPESVKRGAIPTKAEPSHQSDRSRKQ